MARMKREKMMFWRLIQRVLLPMFMAKGIFFRSSAMRATSAVSIATSVPAAPMAIRDMGFKSFLFGYVYDKHLYLYVIIIS